MLLYRIHLNLRCREARRDLSDPYQLHSTLCRAFATPNTKCPEGQFLWRLEPETGRDSAPRVLVQSKVEADWTRMNLPDWLACAEPAIDLKDRLKLDSLSAGRRYRFRLRANPCVTRDRKRIGLMQMADQDAWLVRKGELHGFRVAPALSGNTEGREKGIHVQVSQQQMLRGNQHSGNGIRLFSVLYDGILSVEDESLFEDALRNGIGHGKALGLGLLSVAPVR